ncbi:MAG: hypothetical protein JJE09_10995 [Bacteroidia bacterium]|nr:hypothetical protein [Bacteroidia bacterium]
MKAKDEELQNQIEKAISSDDGVDAYAYKIVFDTLRKEPDSYLSTNFADRVVQKIETRNESTNDFIWFSVGIFTFAIAAVIAIVLTDFKVSFGALKFLASYPGLFVFGIGFILALNWLDKKLVRPKTSI